MGLPSQGHLSSTRTERRASDWWISPNSAFILSMAMTAGVSLLTLTISPPAWQDECQIIDYGRTTFFNPDRSYGLTIGRSGHALEHIIYVGCLIQELAYRCASGSIAGPRWSALIGALFASAALRNWLKATGASPWVATMLGCAFLWDPLIAQSYRGARVDCWCIGFMLTALVCVRRSATSAKSIFWLLAAGVLVALSGLTWATAILLIPLLVQELVLSGERIDAPRDVHHRFIRSWRTTVNRILIVGLAALGATVLLLAPFHDRLYGMVRDLSDVVTTAVGSPVVRTGGQLSRLARQFILSPILPVSAVVGAILVGPRAWLVPLLIAACAAVTTGSSGARIFYLIPYLAYGWAAVANRMATSVPDMGKWRVAIPLVASLILLWSAGLTLVARTSVALAEAQRRSPTLADDFIAKLVGNRKGRVWLGSWSLYYPLRARGWKYWGPEDSRQSDDIAKNLDYDLVIYDEAQGPHRLDSALHANGYLRSVHTLPASGDGSSLFSRLTPGYGPYVVYTRPGWVVEDSDRSQARD